MPVYSGVPVAPVTPGDFEVPVVPEAPGPPLNPEIPVAPAAQELPVDPDQLVHLYLQSH